MQLSQSWLHVFCLQPTTIPEMLKEKTLAATDYVLIPPVPNDRFGSFHLVVKTKQQSQIYLI